MEQPSPSAIDRLRNIAVPTLVTWGDLDFPNIQERSQWLSTAMPQARSQIMQGSAHLPSLDQPERFNPAVSDFLATC